MFHWLGPNCKICKLASATGLQMSKKASSCRSKHLGAPGAVRSTLTESEAENRMSLLRRIWPTLHTFLLCQAGDHAHQGLVPPARQP